MIAVCVTFRLKPGMEAKFTPLMQDQARNSVALEEGCRRFDICAGARDGEIFLYELYDDRAAFDLHLASAHFLQFDAQTKEMIGEKIVAIFPSVSTN